MSVVTLKNGQPAVIDAMRFSSLRALRSEARNTSGKLIPPCAGKHAPILFPIVGSIRDGKAESAQGEVMSGATASHAITSTRLWRRARVP